MRAYRVRHYPKHQVFARGLHLEDDDAGAVGDGRDGQTHLGGEVHHRHRASAQVHRPADAVRGAGYRPDAFVFDDLLHAPDPHAVLVAADEEGEVLPRRCDWLDAHGGVRRHEGDTVGVAARTP